MYSFQLSNSPVSFLSCHGIFWLGRKTFVQASVRGLPIHFHSSLPFLAFPSTLEPFRSFEVLSESSETIWSFWNPRRPSRVPELHPIPFGLTLPHLEAHHCTVPSHADAVYVFSCIPSKVSSEYSLWILPC